MFVPTMITIVSTDTKIVQSYFPDISHGTFDEKETITVLWEKAEQMRCCCIIVVGRSEQK